MPMSEPKNDNTQRTDSENDSSLLTGTVLLDRAIRQAVHHCWTIMPSEKRTPAAVSAEIRRLLERAVRDLENDLLMPGAAT